MKIVVCIDSIKGSMSSYEAGIACRDGILKVIPEADVLIKPVADGGKGTVQALVEGMNDKIKNVTVKNPLGRKINA